MNQPYVYRLTDKQTGRRYIGVRYARGCSPSELGISYFTSSKVVRPLFSADPSRFETQIIVAGATEFVMKVEQSLIDLHDAVLSEDFYNRTNGKAIHPDDIAKGNKIGGAKAGAALAASGFLLTTAKAGGEAARDRKIGIHAFSKEQRAKNGSAGGKTNAASGLLRRIATPASCAAGGKAGGLIAVQSGLLDRLNSERWTCVGCGKTASSGSLAMHQKFSGHKGRERVG